MKETTGHTSVGMLHKCHFFRKSYSVSKVCFMED